MAAVGKAKERHVCVARRAALLAGGDAAALLLFAAIGRSSHGEGLAPGGVLATAAPFLLGAARRVPGCLLVPRKGFACLQKQSLLCLETAEGLLGVFALW